MMTARAIELEGAAEQVKSERSRVTTRRPRESLQIDMRLQAIFSKYSIQ